MMTQYMPYSYRGRIKRVNRWCTAKNVRSMPMSPDEICNFLEEVSETSKVQTVNGYFAAIRHFHKQDARDPNPADSSIVKAKMDDLRSRLRADPVQKAALLKSDIYALVEAIKGDGLKQKRDRLIIALGFIGMYQRSKLVSIRIEDIAPHENGLLIAGKPIARGARVCPCRLLDDYVKALGLKEGPLLRSINKAGKCGTRALSDRWIPEVLKKAAKLAGRNPEIFSSHSLRCGGITSADEHGKSLTSIARLANLSVNSVLPNIRYPDPFKNHAGSGLL